MALGWGLTHTLQAIKFQRMQALLFPRQPNFPQVMAGLIALPAICVHCFVPVFLECVCGH